MKHIVKTLIAVALMTSTAMARTYDSPLDASLAITSSPALGSYISTLIVMTETGTIENPLRKEILLAAQDDAAIYYASQGEMEASGVLAAAIAELRRDANISSLTDLEIAAGLAVAEIQ